MVQFSIGVFVGAILAVFILALVTAGEDRDEDRKRK